jgi:hypothetical protein
MRKTASTLIVGTLAVMLSGCSGETASPLPTTPPPVTATWTADGCRAVEPVGAVLEGLPPVTAEDWVIGPADASITFIEYADFQ